MELSLLDTVSRANEGVEVEIVSPRTGRPSGLTIVVYGKDSQVYRDALKAVYERRTKRTDPSPITVEEAESESAEILARCTKSWNAEEDGKPVALTVDAAMSVYRRYPVIRDQVDRAIADRGNFLPPVSKSSE